MCALHKVADKQAGNRMALSGWVSTGKAGMVCATGQRGQAPLMMLGWHAHIALTLVAGRVATQMPQINVPKSQAQLMICRRRGEANGGAGGSKRRAQTQRAISLHTRLRSSTHLCRHVSIRSKGHKEAHVRPVNDNQHQQRDDLKAGGQK